MTTTERNNITGQTAGILIFNTTTNQLNYWDGTAWAPVVVSNTSKLALGENSGNSLQGNYTIALGRNAGNSSQAADAIAIGRDAGNSGQSTYSIAIGYGAGNTNQPANSITLNATGSTYSPATANALFIKPVRGVATSTPVLVYNTTTGEITYNTSDARLKNNIITINNGLQYVNQLRPVTYDYRESLTDTQYAGSSIGFIAQELKQVIPEAVFTVPGPDSLLAVNTTVIIPMLVSAVKELNEQNKHLADRLQELEKGHNIKKRKKRK